MSGTGPSSCPTCLNQCPLGDTGHTLSSCTGQGTPSLHRAHLSIHIAKTKTVTFSRCPSSHRETCGKTKGSGSSCSPQLSAGRPAAFPWGACHDSLPCTALLPWDEDQVGSILLTPTWWPSLSCVPLRCSRSFSWRLLCALFINGEVFNTPCDGFVMALI